MKKNSKICTNITNVLEEKDVTIVTKYILSIYDRYTDTDMIIFNKAYNHLDMEENTCHHCM